MVENYIKRKGEIEQSSVDNKKEEIKKLEDKVVEEVNVRLGAEISALPKLTAQIEIKNPNI